VTALVGVGVVVWAPIDSPPFAIGSGIIAYALIVLFYTSLSFWRLRRQVE